MFQFQSTMFAHEFTTPKARNTGFFEETDTYLTATSSSSGEGLVTWGEPVEEVEDGEEMIFFGQHEDSFGRVEKTSDNKKKRTRVASIQKKLRKSVVRMKRTLSKFATTSASVSSTSNTGTSICKSSSSSSHSFMSDKSDSPTFQEFQYLDERIKSSPGSNNSFSPTHCWSMSQNPSSNFSFSEYANPEGLDDHRVGRSVFRPLPLDLTATISSTYSTSSSEERHEQKTDTTAAHSSAVAPKRVLRRPTFDISTPKALLAPPTFEIATPKLVLTRPTFEAPTPHDVAPPRKVSFAEASAVAVAQHDRKASLPGCDRMMSLLRRTKPSCNPDEGDDQPPTPSSMTRLSIRPVLSDDSFGIPEEDQSNSTDSENAHDDDAMTSPIPLVDSRRQLRLRVFRQKCRQTWNRARQSLPRWSSRLIGTNNQKEYEGACDDASQYYRQCPERTIQTMPLLF